MCNDSNATVVKRRAVYRLKVPSWNVVANLRIFLCQCVHERFVPAVAPSSSRVEFLEVEERCFLTLRHDIVCFACLALRRLYALSRLSGLDSRNHQASAQVRISENLLYAESFLLSHSGPPKEPGPLPPTLRPEPLAVRSPCEDVQLRMRQSSAHLDDAGHTSSVVS